MNKHLNVKRYIRYGPPWTQISMINSAFCDSHLLLSTSAQKKGSEGNNRTLYTYHYQIACTIWFSQLFMIFYLIFFVAKISIQLPLRNTSAKRFRPLRT
ncbi:hypothetical protein M426DRAFT_211514 [Hypoxylon sp. CI-4A]|nr:hypothetical protein M426DRAFT_211514 [Hypoxylon sp. CI-4A]